jgi:hypothetical protein
MKLCQLHWVALRAAIDARGLTPFVPTDGNEAMERTVKELQEGVSKQSFDPLMMAHNLIVSHCLDIAGLELLTNNDDGSERCPLCFFIENCECGRPDCKNQYEGWVERAADDVFGAAKELGLGSEA